MNYSAIKHNIISLGFAEDSDYEGFEELGYTYDAINRAISEIGMQYPYVSKYEFSIDKEDTGIIYVDMTMVDGFLDFATDAPVMYEEDDKEVFVKFNDYEIEMDTILVIDSTNISGSIRVYYEKECTIVDENTPDDYVPELPKKVHHLIPLLASYYIWLDDDQVKATQYYNMYETENTVVMQKAERPRMRILEGGI